MSESNDWVIFETDLFVAEVDKHLGEFELNALRRQLALEPFAGKPVVGAAPLIGIDYAGATVIYSVNPAKRTIALIQIGKATGKPVEVDAASKSKLKEVAGWLRKGGYIAAGKEAVEWLIEIIKDWL